MVTMSWKLTAESPDRHLQNVKFTNRNDASMMAQPLLLAPVELP